MSWHTITFFGKVSLFLFGLGLGFGLGIYVADPTIIHEGNTVEVEVGKVKRGSHLEVKPQQLQEDQDKLPTHKRRFFRRKARPVD